MAVKRFYRNYFRGRYYHIVRCLEALDFDGKYSRKDLRHIEELKERADVEMNAVRRFDKMSIVLYVAIYFSIVNFLFSGFVVLGDLVAAFREIVTFIGAPIFVGLQLIVIRLREVRFEKLSLLTSSLIAYSVKK